MFFYINTHFINMHILSFFRPTNKQAPLSLIHISKRKKTINFDQCIIEYEF